MSNPRAQLEFGVDAGPAEAGLGKIAVAARATGTAVAQAGETGARGLSEMGNASEATAAKFSRSERSIVSAIQQRTSALATATQGERAFQEALISGRGFDVAKFRPYLDALDAAVSKQRQLASSTVALNNQLRIVGPQISNVNASLVDGQRDVNVYVEQGGGITDMLGDIGPAAAEAGSAIYTLAPALTITVAAAGALAVALGYAFLKGADESRELQNAIVTTGNAAGTTLGQLNDMAARIGQTVGTQGQAAAALAELASNATIAQTGNLEAYARAAVKMQDATGQAIETTVGQFEDLAKSPVQASLKLNESTRFLTAEIFKQIQTLEAQGNTIEAGAVAMKAYGESSENVSKKITDNLGTLARAWREIGDTARNAWDGMLAVGRKDTPESKLADINRSISSAQFDIKNNTQNSQNGEGLLGRYIVSSAKDRIAALEKEKTLAQEQIDKIQQAAAEEGKHNRITQAGVVWESEKVKYLTKQQQLDAEITRIKNQGKAADIKEGEIQDRIALARARANIEKPRAARVEQPDDASTIAKWKQHVDVLNAEAAGIATLTPMQKQYVELLSAITSGKLNITRAGKEELAQLASQALAQEQTNLAQAEQLKITQAWRGEREKAAQSIAAQIEKQREENAAIGQTSEAAAELAAARRDVAAAADDEYAASLRSAAEYAGPWRDQYLAAADAAEELAARQRELGELEREGGARREAVEAAKAAQKEWSTASDDIRRSLSDALMRGFESGKGFLSGFGNAVVNMFKTRIASGIADSLANVAMSAIGGSGGASSGGAVGGIASLISGGKGLGGMLSNASSLYSMVSGGAGYGEAITGVGHLLGSTTISSIGGSASLASMGLTSSLPAEIAAYGGASAGASAAGGIGAAMGVLTTVAPYLAVAAAVYAVIANQSKQDAKASKGTYAMAGIGDAGALNAIHQGGDVVYIKERGGEAYSDSFAKALEPLSQSLTGLATTFGGSSKGIGLGIKASASQGGDDGVAGLDLWSQSGGFSINSGSINQGDFNTWFSTNMPRVVLAGLQHSDLDKPFADYFGSADVSKLTGEQAQAMLNTAAAAKSMYAAFAGLPGALDNVKNLSVETITSFAASFGGLDQAASAISAYRTAIYDQSEQISLAQQQMTETFKSLNLTMPNSRENFRALVESQDLTTASGRQLYTQLVQLAPAFGQLQSTLEQTEAAARQAQQNIANQITQLFVAPADKLAMSMQDMNQVIPDSINGWRALIEAQDSNTESGRAAAQQLLTLYPIWQQVSDAAASAAQQASDAATQAAQQALSAQNALAGQRRDLEIQIMDARGDTSAATAARRTDQLAGAAPSLRDLYSQLYAAQDAAQAAQEAARAQEEANRAASQAAQEAQRAQEELRNGWQRAADSIADTVRNLRNELLGGEQSFIQKQSTFAIATAQARAGDQNAAGTLPELAKALVDASKANAASAAAQAIFTARTLASLKDTVMGMGRYGITIPQFADGGLHAGGLRIVGERGPELEVTGPSRIYSNAALQNALQGGGMLEELRALRAEVAALRMSNSAENSSIASHTAKTARVLGRVDDNDALLVRTSS